MEKREGTVMRRLVWFALGAAVGITVYRKGSVLVADARERGLVATGQTVAAGALDLVARGRALVEQATLQVQAAAAQAARDQQARQSAYPGQWTGGRDHG